MTSALFHFDECCTPSRHLADELGLECHAIATRRFPDGESLVRVPAGVETALLYRSLDNPNAKLVEIILAAAALRDMGARTVVLIAPYLAYMRQDKAFHPGEAVSQKVIGGLISEHFNGLVTVDPHLHRVRSLNEVIPAIPAISLSATPVLAKLIHAYDHPVIVGPDSESQQWTEAIATPLGLETLTAAKQRLGDRNVSLAIAGLERVKDRRVILVDDMISSGRTLVEAAKLLHSAGATSVEAVVTHCLADADVLALMAQNGIAPIASSDSVDGPTSKAQLAPLICRALHEHGLLL